MHTLPLPRGASSTRLSLSTAHTAPEIVLDQIVLARRRINDSLDIVDVSTFTGDPMNASFISGQLRLLQDHITEARHALKGDREDIKKSWNQGSVDPNVRTYSTSLFGGALLTNNNRLLIHRFPTTYHFILQSRKRH